VAGFIEPLAAGSSGSSGLTAFLPFVLIIVVFYFLLIRPQQRRSRAQRELLQGLDVGDEVITIGGIHGTIRALDDDEVTVEVAPGVNLHFVRSAIARTLEFDNNGDYEEEDEHKEEEEAGDQP
jgi:preprotein translocase subunit YajC